MLNFLLLRVRLFPWWYRWCYAKRQHKALIEKFRYVPQVGSWIEDCRGEFHQIAKVDRDGDMVVLDDGTSCSLLSCCDSIKNALEWRDNA